jgi:hypothetical protein
MPAGCTTVQKSDPLYFCTPEKIFDLNVRRLCNWLPNIRCMMNPQPSAAWSGRRFLC